MQNSMLIILIVMIIVMFAFSAYSSKKAAAQRKAQLDAMKPGDKVETIARIFGVIRSVEGEYFILNIGSSRDVLIRIHREGIHHVITSGSSSEPAKPEAAKGETKNETADASKPADNDASKSADNKEDADKKES